MKNVSSGRLTVEIAAFGGIIGQKRVLLSVCPNYMTRDNTKAKVMDFLRNNRWNVQKLYNTFPSHVALYITSIELGNEEIKDYVIWNVTEDGHYSNGSAWNLIRNHRHINTSISNLWDKSIPFKHSFISWRIFFGHLPFRGALSRFGNNEDVDSVCCLVHQNDSIQHTFVEGKDTEHIWKTMGALLGIRHDIMSTEGVFNKWWSIKPKNRVHRLIIQATPIMICWEIWKSWAGCRYGENNIE